MMSEFAEDVPENEHNSSYDSALYHSDSAATVDIDSDWSIGLNSDSDATIMLNEDLMNGDSNSTDYDYQL